MNILLLSAYDAVSHQYWRRGLVSQFPEHQWTVLTLPARYFSWRIRGNSLSWAMSEKETLNQSYDLLIATSMTDLSALKGMVPALAGVPTLVYCHENQFAYPESGREYGSVEPKILNLYTALAADHICFNTGFNRDTFLSGCRRLLKKLPDHVPTGVVEHIEQRASVLPVPLADELYRPGRTEPGALQLVWNHRWEFDKGPELLLKMAQGLIEARVDFRLHVVGQQFRQVPDAFAQLRSLPDKFLGHWGYMESATAYRELLQQADVVLSTALHDFQGIAVLEAVAAGCIPAVPQRLAYPELFPAEYCYPVDGDETRALVSRLAELAQQKSAQALLPPPTISDLSWSTLKPEYARLMNQLAGC